MMEISPLSNPQTHCQDFIDQSMTAIASTTYNLQLSLDKTNILSYIKIVILRNL